MNQSVSTGYLCFLIVAKYLEIAVPKESSEKFTNPSKSDDIEKDLLLLAKKLHMKSKAGTISYKKLEGIHSPVIAKKKDGEYILLLSHKDERWTILNPLKKVPETVEDSELKKELSGYVMLFGRKEIHDRVEGCIQKIGDVAVNIEGLGTVYRVDISLPELPKDNLKIGQEGNCDVIIGQRTVLSYFIEPFIKGLNESMHEK